MAKNAPAVEHTNDPIGCHRAEIQDVAESADNEYYMSAAGPQNGIERERAVRGRSRIVQYTRDLEKLGQKASCLACQAQIAREIEKQRNAVLEIDHVWSNFQ